MQSGRILSNDLLISGALTAAYYIPDFITADEESYLLRKASIHESPKQKWKTLANRRLQLWGGEILRKNILFREEMPRFLTPYPDIVGRLKGTKAFESSPHGEPNHIILNEYLAGQGIMPHEDGPSYYPVVATLSLGSHAVFHYYSYSKSEDGSMQVGSPRPSSGRTINPAPVLSVFLEPRSVIITTGDMYTSHLHGIDEVTDDNFMGNGRLRCQAGKEVMVSNWQAVRAEGMRDVLHFGGTLARKTRFSLTCRDVEKAAAPLKGQALRTSSRG
ncbi:hypothetical protein PAXRUDRAFT_134204 [Paxillus rubicundulus Ve08.2h10]|uniref:Fe2OG dioxygenase domain-containing protein n=1 Tax=Paxillus rubicundulus Ve08.2h10 TaxID=930991 RepID=A0A0D0E319_9AGAM|nr:hypothetical protein PAXRUDRAFT_134204 [Paxillus rubicundulus Ve08.2h10]